MPDLVAAWDSILGLRDPFFVINPANLFSPNFDPNTRIMVFVANLQLLPGEAPSLTTVNLVDSNNQSHDIPAEDVRVVPGFAFVQVTFRLPNDLPPRTCMIKVKAHNLVSNTGIIRIQI